MASRVSDFDIEVNEAAPGTSKQIAARLMPALPAVALLVGAVQAWQQRFVVSSDGLSYLDIGNAFAKGEWSKALNAHWSPLYPFLAGVWLRVTRPNAYWESTVVHGLNLLIFICSIGTFEFFLRELETHLRRSDRADYSRQALPRWTLRVVAYALFLWATLDLIGIGNVNPDLAVAAFVFAALGMLLRLRNRPAGRGTPVAFGIILGLGYLTKAALFPIAFAFVAAMAFRPGAVRAAASPVSLTLGAFLLVAAPLSAALSLKVGHLTIGESGAINYARFVNQIFKAVHWQGGPPGSGVPEHPSRQLLLQPAVYEFASPIAGTYPPWYDPYYWLEGMRPHFQLQGQMRVFRESLKVYWHVLLKLSPVLMLSFIVLLVASGARTWFSEAARLWFLFVPAVVPLLIYALVYTESRYVGAFFATLVIWMFASLRLPETALARKACAIAGIAVAAFCLAPRAYWAISEVRSEVFGSKETRRNDDWLIASGLRELGINAGDQVGYIGDSFRFYWARLAEVRVVAEIRQSRGDDAIAVWAGTQAQTDGDVEAFWNSSAQAQSQALKAFAVAGAKAIITDSAFARDADGWIRLGATSYFVRILKESQDGGVTPREIAGQFELIRLSYAN